MAETSHKTWLQTRVGWIKPLYPLCLTLLFVGLVVTLGGQQLAGPDITKQDTLTQFASKILTQFGSVLGIGAVLAIVADAFSQHQIFQQFADEISQKVGDVVFKDLEGMRALGVERATKGINFNELFGDRKSGDRIYILITYLSAQDECLAAAEAAAMKDVELFFLVMSPESKLLEMRARELWPSYTVPIFSNGLAAFVGGINAMKEELRKTGHDTNVHLVLYKDLIGSPIFLVKSGDEPQFAYSSFYFDKPIDGEKLAYLKWNNRGDSSFIHRIDRYVLDKWKRNAPANEVAAKPQAS
jgi:hypothetical protein